MIYDFDSLIDKLNYLDEETSPMWGKMNSFQMINHCNNFIEVSLGNQKMETVVCFVALDQLNVLQFKKGIVVK